MADTAERFPFRQGLGLINFERHTAISALNRHRNLRRPGFVGGIGHAQIVATGLGCFETENGGGLAVAAPVVVQVSGADVRFEA